VLIIGVLGIIGWFFGIEIFKRFHPRFIPLMLNSALCFIFASLSLILVQLKRNRIIMTIVSCFLAAIVLGLGATTLFEYLSGIDLNIDQLFFKRRSSAIWQYIPGRMSPVSSLNHSFLAITLLLLRYKKTNFHYLQQILLFTAGTIALFSLIGYAYHITGLLEIGSAKPISLQASTAFFCLFLAIFFFQPEKGIAALVLGSSYGGFILRRLILFVVFLPVFITASVSIMYREGFFNISFALLLQSVLTITLFSILFYINSTTLNRTELKRRKAEEARHYSEKRYETLLARANDAILIFNSRGQIIEANQLACLQSGYERKELLNKSLADLPLFSGRANNITRQISRLLHSGQVLFTAPFQRSDGKTIYLEISAKRLESSGEDVTIAISRDITQRKQLEDQLRQAQKMEAIGRLAGGIAHDFNNLLTVINGYCELILDNIQTDQALYHDIEEIRNAGKRAAALTRQLLAFSRKQVLAMKVIELNSLIRGLETMVHRIIGEDIELSTPLYIENMCIKADPGQIEQVIMNLVVNARDAMPEGGKLTVETSLFSFGKEYTEKHLGLKPGNYVVLAISDTGKGMDEETLTRVYEPFFTTKEKDKGTGLGLSTVYGIIKQSNGYINAESELGKGTTFEIYFPELTDYAETGKEQSPRVESLSGSETVLLVEDEDIVRNFISRILKKHGYRVIEASQGQEALDLFIKLRQEIQIVVTDVIMPKMKGVELVRKISDLYPDIHVIFISGYSETLMEQHNLLDKELNFLQKPFSAGTLLNKIREVLDKGR
jgi:PAS domain S-box-containing protein